MGHQPYFNELTKLEPNSVLYQRWLKYALGLSRDDVLYLVKLGLTHQTKALRSMINEITAGRDMPDSLIVKLDVMINAAKRSANQLRSGV